jgi:BRO family, N-terminal domain
MGFDDRTLEMIEEQADATIRRAEIDGIWYFSVIDVVAILTDSTRPKKYWMDMKRRIIDEGFTQASAKCGPLKLQAQDGAYRLTDAADLETMLRIIQSIPSPKAEPIKQWLAKVGATVIRKKTAEVSVPVVTTIEEVKQHKPADDDLLGMAEWYEQLAMVYRQQARLESRVKALEVTAHSQEQQLLDLGLRLDMIEEAHDLLPDLLERLQPERLTPQHQSMIRRWAIELHYATGWHYNAIYQDLIADFAYGNFSDAREADWERIADWFRERMAEARKRR